jgi:hypothetical protein
VIYTHTHTHIYVAIEKERERDPADAQVIPMHAIRVVINTISEADNTLDDICDPQNVKIS